MIVRIITNSREFEEKIERVLFERECWIRRFRGNLETQVEGGNWREISAIINFGLGERPEDLRFEGPVPELGTYAAIERSKIPAFKAGQGLTATFAEAFKEMRRRVDVIVDLSKLSPVHRSRLMEKYSLDFDGLANFLEVSACKQNERNIDLVVERLLCDCGGVDLLSRVHRASCGFAADIVVGEVKPCECGAAAVSGQHSDWCPAK